MDVPKIVSVDDHVVEPPHVWQTWLPEKLREAGPHVVRKRWAPFEHHPGAKYTNTESPDGDWGDGWIYEDRLIYVHKKFVAIPVEATPGGDIEQVRPHDDGDDGGHLRRHAPWLLRARRAVKDFELNWVDGSLPFPTFPRFCGQTFYEANDKELALACVKAYNDWMVEEWCEPSGGVNIPLCLMPLWDIDLAVAEIQRNAARRAGVLLQRAADAAEPAEHPHRALGPGVRPCNDTGVTLCMHIGSSSTDPVASPDAPEGVGGTLAFNNSMASLADWLFSGS